MGAEVKLDARGVWYAQPYLGTAPDGRQVRPRRSFPAAGSSAEAQELADAWYAQLSADGRVKSACRCIRVRTGCAATAMRLP